MLELTEQGFYELRGEGNEAAVVAANVDPAEAESTPKDPLKSCRPPGAEQPAATAATNATPLTPEAREKSQRIWWYLLFAEVSNYGDR